MNTYFKKFLKVNLVTILALLFFVASRLLWVNAEDSDITADTDSIDEMPWGPACVAAAVEHLRAYLDR